MMHMHYSERTWSRKVIAYQSRRISLIERLMADDDTSGVVFMTNQGQFIYANELAHQYLRVVPDGSGVKLLKKVQELLSKVDMSESSPTHGDRVLFTSSDGVLEGSCGKMICRVRQQQYNGVPTYQVFINNKEYTPSIAHIQELRMLEKRYPKIFSFEIKEQLAVMITALGQKQFYVVKVLQDIPRGIKIVKIIDADVVDRVVKNIIADIAHRIATPFALIRGWLAEYASVVKDKDRALVDEQVQYIMTTMEKLKQLRERKEITEKKINLAAFLSRYIKARRKIQPGITWKIMSLRGLNAHIRVDPRRLEDGLDRLVENAVQAIDDRKEVAVKDRKKQGRGAITFIVRPGPTPRSVVLVVRDNGIGMPAYEINRVLHEMRSFIHPGLKRQRGTGWGTNLAREYLVTSNTGKSIRLKSKGYFTGTDVEIVFPVANSGK